MKQTRRQTCDSPPFCFSRFASRRGRISWCLDDFPSRTLRGCFVFGACPFRWPNFFYPAPFLRARLEHAGAKGAPARMRFPRRAFGAGLSRRTRIARARSVREGRIIALSASRRSLALPALRARGAATFGLPSAGAEARGGVIVSGGAGAGRWSRAQTHSGPFWPLRRSDEGWWRVRYQLS